MPQRSLKTLFSSFWTGRDKLASHAVTLRSLVVSGSVFTFHNCAPNLVAVLVQVFRPDRQQHAGADQRRDGDGYPDSPGEPGGAGPFLHRQHHPHTVLHRDIQGSTLTWLRPQLHGERERLSLIGLSLKPGKTRLTQPANLKCPESKALSMNPFTMRNAWILFYDLIALCQSCLVFF